MGGWHSTSMRHAGMSRMSLRGLNRSGFRGDSTTMREDGVHGTTEKISSRVSGEGGAACLRVAGRP